jgi:hypothetical protein
MDLVTLKEATKDLKPKEAAFVMAYINNNYNGVQAYLKVYDTNKASTASAKVPAVLRRPQIRAALDSIRDIALAKSVEDFNITRNGQLQKTELIYQQTKSDPDNFNVALKAIDIQNKTANLYTAENASGGNEYNNCILMLAGSITAQQEALESESGVVVEAEVVVSDSEIGE